MADQQAQAGQHISPTIRLVRPLGQGAMGSVWAAEHLTLGAQVAVKLMSPAYRGDAGFVARFRQEARAAAQLRSPHAVQVLDHGVTEEGTPYIVMELLEGETLRARMKRLGPLPLGEVALLVSQTAKALARAHAAGVVHRDIKPDNLFVLDVQGEPFVKVLDFGIAKLGQAEGADLTTTGRTLGTPLYMSPEQLVSAKHVDFRTDLWSLGIVAYQALTGRLPFMGQTLGALAVAVHTGEPPLPSAVRRELPAAVDVWIRRALQRDPAARFGSAMDMAWGLEKAAADEADPRAAQRNARLTTRRKVPGGSGAADERGSPPLAATPAQSPVILASAKGEAALRIGTRRIQLMLGDFVDLCRRVPADSIVCPHIENGSGSSSWILPSPESFAFLRESFPGRSVSQLPSVIEKSAGRFADPARTIIHVDVTELPRAAKLREAYETSLRIAEENSVRSILFPPLVPLLSSYMLLPPEEAASIAIEAAFDHLSRAAGSVELVVFAQVIPSDHEAFVEALTAKARG